MIHYSTLLWKMHFLLLLMWTLMGMTAAQLQCDPTTQYADGDRCCRMCGPGTSMLQQGTCEAPQCTPCGEGEFQDTYTKESKCQRQPYCDPNKNFKVTVQKDKTKRATCLCKEGFHCSSTNCLTCLPHTVCKPGFGANPTGKHDHDTVCQKCPEGTFSNKSSWDSICQKWTECPMGYHVEDSGTDTTDNKCVYSRFHTVAITLSVVLGAVIIAGILVWLCRGYIKQKAKRCFEPQLYAQENTPQIETKVHMPLTPEENEDDPSHQELSSEGLTENGNCVMQERGKEEVLSRQESQQDSQQETLFSL